MLAAGFVGLPGSAAAQGFVIIGKKSTPPPPKDDGKCQIADDEGTQWIERNPLMKKLDKAFRDTITAWDGLDSKIFHHKGGVDGEYWKGKAKDKIINAGNQLLEDSKDYAARLKPACEICYSLRNWVTLVDVATAQSNNPLGNNLKITKYKIRTAADGSFDGFEDDYSVNIATLTLQQVQDNDKQVSNSENKAIVAARTFLKLFPLRPAISAPDDADPAKCTASLRPTDPMVAPSSKHCAEYMFNQVINYYAGQVVDELRSAGGGAGDTSGSMASHMKKMNPNYLVACPSDVFKDLWKLARFAQ